MQPVPMALEWWIVPAIAFVVWLINVVLRAGQPPPPPPRPRSPLPPGRRPQEQPNAPQTRAGSDIDRFLQEIERMRQRDEPIADAVPARPHTAASPPAAARPVPTSQGRSSKRPRPAAARPAPPPPPPPPPVVPELTTEQAIERAFEKFELGGPILSASHLPSGKPTAPAIPVPPREAITAVSLLRSPETLRTAFVLREILDAPRSRRRLR